MSPSAAFLKYARQNTPRYTSYPTAPHFHEGVDARVVSRWLTDLRPDARGSLYLHIPYCREMCWYCGCSTRATRRDGPVATYTELLLEEIGLYAERLAARPRIDHVHFGGGTPTILSGVQFSAIMARLRAVFEISGTAEIAVEVDPRLFSAGKARELAAAGVNRASLGVQTLDPAVQKKINRIQPAQSVANCVRDLRDAGIDHVSFDLLYGLPGQTIQSCLDTVRQALAFEPDRLSIFGYAHVPHLKRHQRLIRDEDLPDTEARIEQALAMNRAAREAGYVPVGIDHYAGPDDDMAKMAATGTLHRNFQGYTTDRAEYLLGLGASAITRTPSGYAQNTPDVVQWSRAIMSEQLATVRGIALGPEDRLRGEIIERLMCDLRVDISALSARIPDTIPMPSMDDLLEDGIVHREGNQLTLLEENRMLARVVAARFDAYAPSNGTARHSPSV
ncbi:oxygen-independent coproporphyrinogen III oxidase [Hyphobacterium marinum]|uniref:Coproporphyrinogen-III oxidase n=1 Tax=Hyphobacterium marinum TaxID=3116574 RepID=A0ABU7LU96_9PROT|nr:oxygen-independent coproporphyrinogen III oxidase [Hyphobacterium sp. Y6023]MEE2565109.1 oxygen-independent coproporphyrinogen III oxidase [Hyphobacterium sp. Y6023]